jgi:hypothetical protein
LARGALGALGTVFGVNGSSAITGATLVAPALGTPASGVLTNCTGTVNDLNAGLGVNQTWTDVSASRIFSTTYTNSTGKPISVAVSNFTTSQLISSISFTVNGTVIAYSGVNQGSAGSQYSFLTAIVPNGATYTSTLLNASNSKTWFELR